MKINFDANEDQVAIIKAMGSKNKSVSAEAVEAFAGVLGPVIQQVLLQADTTSLYTDQTFGEDDNPSYPLDLHYQRAAGTVPVWSQRQAGGLATSTLEGYQEMKIDIRWWMKCDDDYYVPKKGVCVPNSVIKDKLMPILNDLISKYE